jgi:hypothetical protein
LCLRRNPPGSHLRASMRHYLRSIGTEREWHRLSTRADWGSTPGAGTTFNDLAPRPGEPNWSSNIL